MDKKTIINEICIRTGKSTKETTHFVNTFIEVIKDSVSQKMKVTLRGFGTFLPIFREARTARNPKLNTPVSLPDRFIIKFRPSEDFNKRINS